MLVLPIGTKGSLALKPKLTIALIAANAVVALLTLPLVHHAGKDLFRVQCERFSLQLRLYVEEYPCEHLTAGSAGERGENASLEIERAEDPRGLELALLEAFVQCGVDPDDFRRYETTLRERDDFHYLGDRNDGAALFAEWREIERKEARLAEGGVFNRLGLVPGKMNRAHTFFTHMFLHGGIAHLLGNMLFLWVVGCLLEDTWGRLPFLLFYLAGGVAAGLAHCLQDTSSTVPLVGASGAIAAAMGAFTIRHFWTQIKLFYFFLFFLKPVTGTFYLPAFVFLPLWFLQQVCLHYLNGSLGGDSSVAYMAHIGGFSMGIVGALAMKFTGFESRFLAPALRKTHVEAGVLKDPRFERACELLERGNVDSARALFEKLFSDRPEDIELLRDVAMLYRERGLTADYAALIEKSLKLLILKGSMEEASSLALEILRDGESISLNAQLLMRVAKHLADRRLYGESHDVYRSIIASHPASNTAIKASLALARLLGEKMNNTRDARAVLDEARRQPLDAEWEAAIAEIEAVLSTREYTLYA